MNQNSVVSIKSNKLLDISLDSGDEVSAGVKQIVSQFSLDRSINASSNPITIAEYTFIRAAIVFLLSSSDEDLNKKLNWGKTILRSVSWNDYRLCFKHTNIDFLSWLSFHNKRDCIYFVIVRFDIKLLYWLYSRSDQSKVLGKEQGCTGYLYRTDERPCLWF